MSALDGIQTSDQGIHWISRSTLYQLSHHVPPSFSIIVMNIFNSFWTITGIFRLRQASLQDHYRNFPVSWVHSTTEAVSTFSQLDTMFKELLPLLHTSANTWVSLKRKKSQKMSFKKIGWEKRFLMYRKFWKNWLLTHSDSDIYSLNSSSNSESESDIVHTKFGINLLKNTRVIPLWMKRPVL